MVKISLDRVRFQILQNYFRLRDQNHTVADVLKSSAYIQIDTISRVQRAHLHSLWNRLPRFTPQELQETQERGEIFEYWSHAAAYLPWEAYRFCLPRMRRIQKKRWDWFPEKDKKMIRLVLDRIRQEGPLQSSDFKDSTHKSGGWWQWKPAKMALEQLFHEGKLMVRSRKGFQKLFDLPERVLPTNTNTKSPTPREMAAYLIDYTLKNQGISRLPYLRGQHRDKIDSLGQEVQKQRKEDSIVALEIQGLGVWYGRPEFVQELLDQKESSWEPQARVLSPFDNLIIQRAWCEELLGFPYRLECYVPAEKRRYGYFTLPLLSNLGFLGLLEARALRKEKILQIESFYPEMEPGALMEEVNWDRWGPVLEREIQAFAHFNGCPQVIWDSQAKSQKKW